MKKTNRKKPLKGSFQKEAKFLSVSGLLPVGIGVVLALIFWFTR